LFFANKDVVGKAIGDHLPDCLLRCHIGIGHQVSGCLGPRLELTLKRENLPPASPCGLFARLQPFV
jgi:hypothetical protein